MANNRRHLDNNKSNETFLRKQKKCKFKRPNNSHDRQLRSKTNHGKIRIHNVPNGTSIPDKSNRKKQPRKFYDRMIKRKELSTSTTVKSRKLYDNLLNCYSSIKLHVERLLKHYSNNYHQSTSKTSLTISNLKELQSYKNVIELTVVCAKKPITIKLNKYIMVWYLKNYISNLLNVKQNSFYLQTSNDKSLNERISLEENNIQNNDEILVKFRLGGGSPVASEIQLKCFTNNSFISSSQDSQYCNLNLNETHKSSTINSIQSKNISINNERKITDFSDQKDHRNDTKTWSKNEFEKNLKPFEYLTLNDSKEKQVTKKSNNNNNNNSNNSTLSLHITAYENSIEATKSDEKNNLNEFPSKKKNNFGKAWKELKQHLDDPKSKNLYEFPRQQENEKNNEPEIMQFKASQKLLDSKQSGKKKKAPQKKNASIELLKFEEFFAANISFSTESRQLLFDHEQYFPTKEATRLSTFLNANPEECLVLNDVGPQSKCVLNRMVYALQNMLHLSNQKYMIINICSTADCINPGPKHKSIVKKTLKRNSDGTMTLNGNVSLSSVTYINRLNALLQEPPNNDISLITNFLLSTMTEPVKAELELSLDPYLQLYVKFSELSVENLAQQLSTFDCIFVPNFNGCMKMAVQKCCYMLATKNRNFSNLNDVILCESCNDEKVCINFQHHLIKGPMTNVYQIEKLPILPSSAHPSELPTMQSESSSEDDATEANFDPMTFNNAAEDEIDSIAGCDVSENIIKKVFELLIKNSDLPQQLRKNSSLLYSWLEGIARGGILETRNSNVKWKELLEKGRKYVYENATISKFNRNEISIGRAVILVSNVLALPFLYDRVIHIQNNLQVQEDTKEDITKSLQEYCTNICTLICKNIDEKGFKSRYDWPLVKTDSTLVNSIRHLCNYVCYRVALKINFNLEDFMKREEQETTLLNYRSFLKDEYQRRGNFMVANRCLVQGIKKLNRTNTKVSDEHSLVMLSSVRNVMPAIGVALKYMGVYDMHKDSFKLGSINESISFKNDAKQTRSSTSKYIYPLTYSYDIQKYLIAKEQEFVRTIYDHQMGVLWLFATKFGPRIGSVISIDYSSTVPSTPGLLLRNIHFTWVGNKLEISFDVLFTKTLATLTYHSTCDCSRLKYCLNCQLLILLEAQQVFTLPLLEGIKQQHLSIKPEFLDRCLFVSGDCSGRLTEKPLDRHSVEISLQDVSKILKVPDSFLTFKSARQGTALEETLEMMYVLKSAATITSIRLKLQSNQNWKSECCLVYIDYGDDELVRTMDLFNKEVLINPDLHPRQIHRFTSDFFGGSCAFLKEGNALAQIIYDNFSPSWFADKSPTDEIQLRKHRLKSITSELNSMLYHVKDNFDGTDMSMFERNDVIVDMDSIFGFYTYPLRSDGHLKRANVCVIKGCDIEGSTEELANHMQEHDSDESPIYVCFICETEFSPSAGTTGHKKLVHHIHLQHNMNNICRACNFFLPNSYLDQCIARNHNIVKSGSFHLHWKIREIEDASEAEESTEHIIVASESGVSSVETETSTCEKVSAVAGNSIAPEQSIISKSRLIDILNTKAPLYSAGKFDNWLEMGYVLEGINDTEFAYVRSLMESFK